MRRLLMPVLLFGVLAVNASPAAAATASTGLAQPTSTTARLDGIVGPKGTSYHFEYGTSTSYGQQTTSTPSDPAAPSFGCADCAQVSAEVSGLTPSTTYHWRIVAEGSGGAVGEDRTFTTQPPPPDSDGDGYPDNQDACPGQPGGPAGPTNPQGCPPPATTGGGGSPTGGQPNPNDVDGDGVANATDKCPQSENEKVDARGCGPFTASATFGARSTKEMQTDDDVQAQCQNAAGRQCKFHLTLTLSQASAQKLGIARKIIDVTFTTNKSTFGGKYVYNSKSSLLKAAAEKAFKRAYDKNIAVTMTFTGTYVLGMDAAIKLPKSTFTMKRKPPGGSAYRIQPRISDGDNGPSSTGLTRPANPNDS